MISKIKILILYDRNGCCFWRSWQPFQMIHKNGLAECRFVELRITTKQVLAAELAWCDVVHMLGIMDTNGLALMRQYKSLGLKVVIDYDDLHFNVSPFNLAYRNFGVEDVQVRDPKTGDVQYLWKDGKNGFDIKKNKIKFHAYREILKEADLVTTTTLYLKNAMLEVQPEATIKALPNAVDLTQWKPLDIRDKFKDKFRFGWAVSGSHGEDWLFVRPALLAFLKAHKDAKFVVIGDTYMDIKEGMAEVKDQIEWYSFSDLWEGHYQFRMPLLGLDVAIAPLANIEFNKCKSPLKFAECTAFGWPVIAQKMLPYSECMVHGHNGLLAETIPDWVNCLESLYTNVDLRHKLHFNALYTVKALFDLKEVHKEYAEIYTNLVRGEIHVGD